MQPARGGGGGGVQAITAKRCCVIGVNVPVSPGAAIHPQQSGLYALNSCLFSSGQKPLARFLIRRREKRMAALFTEKQKYNKYVIKGFDPRWVRERWRDCVRLQSTAPASSASSVPSVATRSFTPQGDGSGAGTQNPPPHTHFLLPLVRMCSPAPTRVPGPGCWRNWPREHPHSFTTLSCYPDWLTVGKYI